VAIANRNSRALHRLAGASYQRRLFSAVHLRVGEPQQRIRPSPSSGHMAMPAHALTESRWWFE
jgi:hypothetical protein